MTPLALPSRVVVARLCFLALALVASSCDGASRPDAPSVEPGDPTRDHLVLQASGEVVLERGSGIEPTFVIDGGSLFLASAEGRVPVLSRSRFERAEGVDLASTAPDAHFQEREGRMRLSRSPVLEEWYEARAGGLEQGWRIAARFGDGSDALRVRLGVGPDARIVEAVGNRVVLEAAGTRLDYADLAATDATGQQLATEMLVEDDALVLRVDDAAATYPIEIDPVLVITTSYNLLATGGATPTSQFGTATAVDGTTILVSEPDVAATATYVQGQVHRYTWNGTTWTAQAPTIRMPIESGVTGPATLGRSLDFLGSWAVLGASAAASNKGAVYFLDLSSVNATTGIPATRARFASPTATGLFGWSVGMSTTRAVVGGWSTNRVWTYTRSGSTWTQDAATLPPGGGSGTGTYGSAVDIDALDPNWLVVGAPTASTNGVAYAYHWTGSAWVETVFAAPSGYSSFGTSVAIHGTRLAIAALNTTTHRVELFLSTRAGTTWSTPTSSLTSTGFVSVDAAITNLSANQTPHVAVSDNLRLLGFPNSTQTWAAGQTIFGWEDFGGVTGVGLSWSGSARYRGRSMETNESWIVVSQESTTGFPAYVTAFPVRLANGQACTGGAECEAGYCVDGVCCNNACAGGTSDCQACSMAAGAAVNGTCGAIRAGFTVVCRTAAGVCDAAESCSPSSTVCPSDGFLSGSVCRGSVGACDVAETCSGASASCPSDAYRPAGYVCAAASGVCDLDDLCTGSSTSCPARYAPSNQVCRSAALGPDGTTCDVAEFCTGSSTTCPADAFRTGTCRATAGPCDVAETCTGAGPSCPGDGYRASGYVCAAASGACDLADVCTGTGISCPPRYAPSTQVCRAAVAGPDGTTCDTAESCTGSSPTCPTDVALPGGTSCRSAVGPCDVAEACNGVSTSCPSDALRPSSYVCRAAAPGEPCDHVETCSGTGVVCPADTFIPPTMVCSACMNGTVPQPDGTACGADRQCYEGFCRPLAAGTCGDGVRKPGPAGREGCDDGYNDDGDACDATCHPTALIVAGRGGRRDETAGQIPAVAEDGTGQLLFVWLADRLQGGEPTVDVVARRYTSAGHPIDAAPIVLEAGVGISQDARPTVAGMAQGWAVTWRSTSVETTGAAQGGIAIRTVSRDGVLGTRRLVNETTRGDQLDPVIANVTSGAVVVWVDLSADGIHGDLRARTIDTTGRPTGHELVVAADGSLDESRPFVVARGTPRAPSTRWAVAWATGDAEQSLLPQVRLRRFDGTTALDAADLHVSHAWGSEVSLAATSSGVYATWTSRAADANGDIAARFVADTTTTIADDLTGVDHYTDADETGTLARHYAETAPAIAAVTGGYVIAFHTTAAPDGGRLVVSAGATVAPEAMDLESELLVGDRASLVSTGRGLWATYQNQTAVSTATSFVAFLMAGS